MPSSNEEPPKRPSLRNPASLIATWFGVGLLPKFPGTWASLVALPLAWVIRDASDQWILFAAACLVFAVGLPCADTYIRENGGDDPGPVVIDEVAGQWMTLVAAPLNVYFYALAFILFRIADIWKPWPVSLVDRRAKGGMGVMLDDFVAAIYAGGVVYAVAFWVYP